MPNTGNSSHQLWLANTSSQTQPSLKDLMLEIVPWAENLVAEAGYNFDPHSLYGMHHGPWRMSHLDHMNNSNPSLHLSKVTTGICDYVVDSNGTMCGSVFHYSPNSAEIATAGQQRRLRWHLTHRHDARLSPVYPSLPRVSFTEQRTAYKFIMAYVLLGKHRRAQYMVEPDNPPEPIRSICDDAEKFALENEDFRRKYGLFFHRDSYPGGQAFRQWQISNSERIPLSESHPEQTERLLPFLNQEFVPPLDVLLHHEDEVDIFGDVDDTLFW